MSIKKIIKSYLTRWQYIRAKQQFLRMVKRELNEGRLVIVERSILLTPEGRDMISSGEYFLYKSVGKVLKSAVFIDILTDYERSEK